PRHPQQAPSAPGYGHHPTPGVPAPYNPYAADGGGPGGAPPYAAYGTDEPVGPQDPPGRSRRATVLLVLVALVVAVAAGGSVYAFMNGDDDSAAGPSPSTSASRTAGSSPEADPSSSPSTSASPSPSRSGEVPAAYLGDWTATIRNDTGTNKRRLTISQGEVGDTVLVLAADGDSYHCEFSATLAGRPGEDGPLRIGPSKVTAGRPLSSCTPGAASEVTLLPDGSLQRVNTGTGEKLTYTRG
ncbi:serine/threonine protein kinase, partial [Streptomyces sp. ID05-04B]|nr:serine/threonine protein kinase [Streptomyces sp. ID05-04B]